MTDSNLGFTVTARDETAGTLAQLQSRLRSIGAEQASLISRYGAYAGASSRVSQALNAEAASIQQIISLQQQLISTNEATATSTNAVSRAIHSIGGASVTANRELKHVIAGFDELASGRKGQFVSTLGSALRDAGIGASSLAIGIGAIAATAAFASVLRTADQMANLNEQIKAGAQVTGMGVRQYAELQGALQLTGEKAESADAALRHFASSIEKGMANPSSSQAKAFHALAISQGELQRSGQDTYEMLKKVAEQLNKFADSSTKAAAWTEIFGRGDEAIAHFLGRFQELTTESGKWADAVEKNNAEFNKMAEQIHQLSLNWETLKEEAAAPLDFIVNISIYGLEALKEIPQDFAKLGKYIYDFARPVREFLGTTSPFEGAPALPNTTLDDLQVTAKAVDPRPKVPVFSTPKPKSGAAEAHKDFTAFSDEERNKLRDVNLTLEEQKAILAEWAAGAQAAFAKGTLSAAGLRLELAKINTVALELQKMNFDRIFSRVKSDLSDSNRELREFETNMETMVKRHQLTNQQAVGFDIQRQAQVQRAGEGQIQSLYGEPGADVSKINQAWNTFESEQNAAAASLQEKYAAADATLAKQFEKAFAGVFDKIGSSFEKYITEAITKSTTAGKAGQGLFRSLAGSGVGLIGDIGSQFGAKLLGGTPGEGLGQVLSSKLFSLIPGLGGQGVQSAQVVAVAANTEAVLANTAAILGGSGIAGGAGAIGVAGLFARGGIVPSAAGGMVVGPGGGGQIAVLHPREMVLPANIADHVMNTAGGRGEGGNTSINYAPSVNGGGGFRNQTSAENFFRKHGSDMEKVFRSAYRNKWRP